MFKSQYRKKTLIFLSTIIFSLIAFAQESAPKVVINPATLTATGPIAAHPKATAAIPSPPAFPAKGYILMDANSGDILAAQNPDMRLEPASLTKVMTMYVVSEMLRSGKIHLTDMVTISKKAWKTGGSRMFIAAGSQVSVQDLINGIVVVSGNDAAVALAEYVAGSEENFVQLMNQAAAKLGMKNTHFSDVNGLPAPNHYSSARDLAILARAIIEEYPEDYKWYNQKSFEFSKIKQSNRNRLLWRDPTVDGLKTGYTDAAGYCLIASAQRNGMRLISVLLGAPSPTSRMTSTQALLNWGFRNYSTHQLYAANQTLAEPRVWFGKNKFSPIGIPNPVFVTIPNGQYKNLKATLTLNDNLAAPVTKGAAYGQVTVTLNDQVLATQPVVALQDNPKGNLFERLHDRVILLFRTPPNKTYANNINKPA